MNKHNNFIGAVAYIYSKLFAVLNGNGGRKEGKHEEKYYVESHI